MAEALILLGTNLPPKMQNLRLAQGYIEKQIGKITGISSVYESTPWGFNHPENFYNQVIQVNCRTTPQLLLQKLLAIEVSMGRTRNTQHYEARTIDLDILFYDDEIINSGDLTIPHPRLHLRRFTLIPIVEIAPNKLHPVLKVTLSDLLKHCSDGGEVKRLGLE